MILKRISKPAVYTALFVVSVFLSGCENNTPATEDAQTAPPEVGVVVMETESVVLTTELPGRVTAFRVAEIRPQVSGLLRERLFTEGADVEAGQVLYQIDESLYRAELENAEANLAVAQKTVGRMKALLQASQANINQQKATLNFAQKNRSRFEELTEGGAVSLTERDQAVTGDEVAQAALKFAEAQERRDREAIAEAEAAIKQAEAVVKTAQINLDYTRITAPISGRIGKSDITEGAIVTAYQPLALATIQQLDPVYVDVPQSTTELLRLRKRLENKNIVQNGIQQNKVKIYLEDGTEYPQEGDLHFRDITVDPTMGTVVLRIVVPNPDHVLLPGMFVRGEITEGKNQQAILIPQQAVSRDPKGNAYTLLVDSENEIQQQTLTLDRSFGNRWLVTSGLKAGDRVMVEGMQKVRPGATVDPVIVDVSQSAETTNLESK
ncbi:MAG: efflux RND transporter periplasmic adaptor subunit [Candidatus Omnitrophota bacterium]|jgi:membrane fusion protein (multidrug efflux system)|nr:MAG: efflux RND transporter periplasmic adaptor subunit [Candidatus Omnitrophota bacterium]